MLIRILLFAIATGIWFVGYWLRELYDLINQFDKPFLYSPDETDNVVWGTTTKKGKKS